MLTAGEDEVDDGQLDQTCSVLEAGSVEVLVIFTSVEELLVVLDQSSQVWDGS